MDDLDSKSIAYKISSISKEDDKSMKDDLTLLFKEWFTAFCHPASNEKLHFDLVGKV